MNECRLKMRPVLVLMLEGGKTEGLTSSMMGESACMFVIDKNLLKTSLLELSFS